MADFYRNSRKEQNRNSFFSQFAIKEKKKMSNQPTDFSKKHSFSSMNASVVMLPKENNADKMDNLSRKNNQKTLTWRSPLVFSPNKKFSPQNISHGFQVRNKETGRNQIFNDSMKSITSRSNKDLALSFQNSPKKSICSQNPLNKKTRSSIFVLSDKENFELDGINNNEKMEIDSRPVEKGKEQVYHQTKKLPNAMEYYSQLSRSNSLDEEKRAIDRNRNNKKIINDDQNISQFGHIQDDQAMISKEIQSTSNSQITSLDGKQYSPHTEQQYIRARSNQNYWGNETHRQLNYPINPNCNFNRQFSDCRNIGYCCSNDSFNERNYEDCLNKSFHYSPSKFSRNDTCVLNAQSTHIYPNAGLLTKCCGRDCETSMTCKSVPVLNSTLSPRSLNQLSKNQGRMPQVGCEQYNYPLGFYSQQRTKASCYQSAKQMCAQSESNNQMLNSMVLNENPGCFRRIPSHGNYNPDYNGNSVLYEEDEFNVGSSSQSRRTQKVNSCTGNERAPLNLFDSHNYGQPFPPMGRQHPSKNVAPAESFPHDEDFTTLPMQICNCQKCIRQNATNTYGISMLPPYSADYYTYHHSPYFQVPSATLNPQSFSNFYVPFHGNPDPEIIPPTWYCPAQVNDKGYVMQKFLCSLDQNH